MRISIWYSGQKCAQPCRKANNEVKEKEIDLVPSACHRFQLLQDILAEPVAIPTEYKGNGLS